MSSLPIENNSHGGTRTPASRAGDGRETFFMDCGKPVMDWIEMVVEVEMANLFASWPCNIQCLCWYVPF